MTILAVREISLATRVEEAYRSQDSRQVEPKDTTTWLYMVGYESSNVTDSIGVSLTDEMRACLIEMLLNYRPGDASKVITFRNGERVKNE